RRGGLDEAGRAAAVDDHRVALGLDLVLEVDLAGELALDRADLDLDLADVLAIDQIELLAARHDRGQDHRIEQRAPHLGNGGVEQIVTFELHGSTSASGRTHAGCPCAAESAPAGWRAPGATASRGSAGNRRRERARRPCPGRWA